MSQALGRVVRMPVHTRVESSALGPVALSGTGDAAFLWFCLLLDTAFPNFSTCFLVQSGSVVQGSRSLQRSTCHLSQLRKLPVLQQADSHLDFVLFLCAFACIKGTEEQERLWRTRTGEEKEKLHEKNRTIRF
jgi:hypothetical protein